jgi:hypothetical protein
MEKPLKQKGFAELYCDTFLDLDLDILLSHPGLISVLKRIN